MIFVGSEDGRFHYIETGSLISIKKNVENIVIPSEEMKVQMYPMDFEEFLWALDADGVMQLIRKRFTDRVPMGQHDHRMVMELFRQYLVIGGMPQAVEAFSRGRDLASAEVETPAQGGWRFFKVGVEMVAVLRTATSGQRGGELGLPGGDIRTARRRVGFAGGWLRLQGGGVVMICGALRREACL